jgi:hypothetical protein
LRFTNRQKWEFASRLSDQTDLRDVAEQLVRGLGSLTPGDLEHVGAGLDLSIPPQHVGETSPDAGWG